VSDTFVSADIYALTLHTMRLRSRPVRRDQRDPSPTQDVCDCCPRFPDLRLRRAKEACRSLGICFRLPRKIRRKRCGGRPGKGSVARVQDAWGHITENPARRPGPRLHDRVKARSAEDVCGTGLLPVTIKLVHKGVMCVEEGTVGRRDKPLPSATSTRRFTSTQDPCQWDARVLGHQA
jgi:hypothetical protein